MRYHAGLDLSLEETVIWIVDERGRVMRELRAACEPDALIGALTLRCASRRERPRRRWERCRTRRIATMPPAQIVRTGSYCAVST
jgi:hypothetical protein